MHYLFFLLLFISGTQPLFSQQKNDCTWVLGYPTSIPGQPNNEDFGGMLLKFNENGYSVETFDIFGGPISAVANDENGDLLFYTNGCSIFNKENQIMENGDEINLGSINYDQECYEYLGTFYIRSGNMTLPMPGNPQKQILIHTKAIATSDTNIYDVIFDRLLYTGIDIETNNGLARCFKKTKLWLQIVCMTQSLR